MAPSYRWLISPLLHFRFFPPTLSYFLIKTKQTNNKNNKTVQTFRSGSLPCLFLLWQIIPKLSFSALVYDPCLNVSLWVLLNPLQRCVFCFIISYIFLNRTINRKPALDATSLLPILSQMVWVGLIHTHS